MLIIDLNIEGKDENVQDHKRTDFLNFFFSTIDD